MKDSPWTSRVLTGASVVRLVLSAAMFVPMGMIACAVVGESLGLPSPADDSPVVLLSMAVGGICGLMVGFASRKRRDVNALMATFGVVGAIGFGTVAVRMAVANAAASGLLAALSSAMSTVFFGIAAAMCLLAVGVGCLGLICMRRGHVT